MRITQNSNNLYTLPAMADKKRAHNKFAGNAWLDNICFSTSGKTFAGKLIIRTDNIATGSFDSLQSLSDPSMRLMGQSIIEVREILEEMKSLSDKASDSNLSWNDRIDMQIKMTDLQVELYEKTHGMGLTLAQSEPGVFADGDIYTWHDSMVMRLDRMRKDGLDSPGGVVTDLYDSYGEKNGEMVRFSSGDFELDENGGLKIRDGVFESLPDHIKSGLDETLLIFSSGKSLFSLGGLSDEDLLKGWSLSLFDAGSAGKTNEKIQEQIDDLKVAEAEFNRMASVDPTVINEHKAAGSLKNGLLHTRLGIMEQNPQNTLDVRLTEVNDPIGRLFKKIDRLFKENIIKSLGFSDGLMAKSSGINAEQLAKINWYKEKLAS